jgi:hypothetical protein
VNISTIITETAAAVMTMIMNMSITITAAAVTITNIKKTAPVSADTITKPRAASVTTAAWAESFSPLSAVF